MSDAVKRGLRTFFQAFLGSIITSGALSGLGADGVIDFSILQKAGVSALAAGVIGLVSYIQNALEDSGAVPEVIEK